MHEYVTIHLNLSVSPDQVETALAVLHEQMLQAGRPLREGEITVTKLLAAADVRPPALTIVPRMYC